MYMEVVGRRGRVVARFVCCCLCDEFVPLSQIDVFEGPGQRVPACTSCIAEFSSWCEGRSQVEDPAEAEAA